MAIWTSAAAHLVDILSSAKVGRTRWSKRFGLSGATFGLAQGGTRSHEGGRLSKEGAGCGEASSRTVTEDCPGRDFAALKAIGYPCQGDA